MFILFTISLCLVLVLSQDGNRKDSVVSQAQDQNYDDITFRVVNGKPATLGQIPYQVSIKLRGKSSRYISFCGGSIVGKSKILSAGHCFMKVGNICQQACGIHKRKNLKIMYAVAGTLRTLGYYKSDSEGTEQWRGIKDVIVPQGYVFPTKDIALAFTTTPFVINDYVRALPMAKITMDYGSITCQVSGYGRISDEIISDSLLWANLQLIPMGQCSLLHHRDMRKYICTSSDVSTVLRGDSGGPLVCKNTGDPNDLGQGVIVGVVSGAEKHPKLNKWNAFFTRVSSYRSFYLRNNTATTLMPSRLYIYVLVFTILTKSGYFLLFDFYKISALYYA